MDEGIILAPKDKSDEISHLADDGAVDVAQFYEVSQTVELHGVRDYVLPLLANIDSIKNALNPTSTYVAKIPQEILAKMQSGEYDFMKSGDELLANIVDKKVPKKPIVHQVRLMEVVDRAQSLANLGQFLMDMARQQQLAEMSKKLDAVLEKTNQVLVGQLTDRLGEILGARDLMLQASQIEQNQLKMDLIKDALASLNIGRRKVLLYLNSSTGVYDKLPKTAMEAFIKNLNGKMLKESKELYNSTAQAISGLLAATVSMANAYVYLGEEQLVEDIFKPVYELFEQNKDRYLNLCDIALEAFEPMDIVYKPEDIRQLVSDVMNPRQLNMADVIEVEFTEKDLSQMGGHDDGKKS